MNWKLRLSYSQNWNIGFCEQSSEEFIKSKKLNKVQWMKHSYRDRWFADPFIYKINTKEIVVFVEECTIEKPKGILCELHIDRKTKRLKERYVILELDTHLSYPAIIQHKGKTYVYPENGVSGKLNIYEYDELNHKLINPICIIDESLADSTIIKQDEKYYLIATKYPNTQMGSYLFSSNFFLEPFKKEIIGCVQDKKDSSRPGGNWIVVNNSLYRPAQDCIKRYGSALSLMQITSISPDYSEEKKFSVLPKSFRYSNGIHTINFYDGLCVVDGYGYLFPFVGIILKLAKAIKHRKNPK